jgi:hypothetical protein
MIYLHLPGKVPAHIVQKCIVIKKIISHRQDQHSHRLRRIQLFDPHLHCEYILQAILVFERFKKVVSGIFGVTNNENIKLTVLKYPAPFNHTASFSTILFLFCPEQLSNIMFNSLQVDLHGEDSAASTFS